MKEVSPLEVLGMGIIEYTVILKPAAKRLTTEGPDVFRGFEGIEIVDVRPWRVDIRGDFHEPGLTN